MSLIDSQLLWLQFLYIDLFIIIPVAVTSTLADVSLSCEA